MTGRVYYCISFAPTYYNETGLKSTCKGKALEQEETLQTYYSRIHLATALSATLQRSQVIVAYSIFNTSKPHGNFRKNVIACLFCDELSVESTIQNAKH